MKRKSSGFILLTAVLLFSGCTLLTGPTMDGQEISLIKEVVYDDSSGTVVVTVVPETGVNLTHLKFGIYDDGGNSPNSNEGPNLFWDTTFSIGSQAFLLIITVTDSKGNTEVFTDTLYLQIA